MAILSAAAATHIAFVVFLFETTRRRRYGTRAEFIFDVFLLCATSRNEQMQLYTLLYDDHMDHTMYHIQRFFINLSVCRESRINFVRDFVLCAF